MDAFREWLQSSLGLGPVIQDVLLFPFLAVFLVWAIGSAVLAILFLKVKAAEVRQANWPMLGGESPLR